MPRLAMLEAGTRLGVGLMSVLLGGLVRVGGVWLPGICEALVVLKLWKNFPRKKVMFLKK